MTDERYMKRALQLARRGEKWVSPNPMVGAVIVKQNRIIGEGWHRRFGGDHAEINALRSASESIADSTIYITLEPCCHHGKTPPCVESLIAERPARIVIGMTDPNPLVCGGGIERLVEAGISTAVGVLETECRRLNERFIKFIQTRTPFVTLKFAQTLDGRIATAAGHSRWISSPASLKFAHALRAIHDGILVGSGTVFKDDPELTVRLVKGRNPVRIVVDTCLSLSPEAAVFKNQDKAKTIVATTEAANRKQREALGKMGIETILVDGDRHQRVDLDKLMVELGKRDISSVLVEGGAGVITSVLRERLADRIVVVVAPKIVGKGIEAVCDLGIRIMDDAMKISVRQVTRKGGDFVLDGQIQKKPGNP
ncbi:MAG: bifunctional diaminohydroxyphosphoribosylaminopyrimidine deaminase/5-amino-6-(5-phosphoribosylamino)uracil reductase RibD [Syntrophus sp. (in: bacteria)]|nr:bifunctional diaminohydroxyphosphoribosylaminopyrimidine deaminase/5-amino-6-(5-phosphoribosylamino)uracil reductase RibD [Syntrophus sp. (in: bacteria)]